MTDTEFFVMHGLWCDADAFVFKSRSDRNEMALSMFQELSYEMFYDYLQNGSRNPNREWNCAADNLITKTLFRSRASGSIGCDRVIVMAENHPSEGMRLYGLNSYQIIVGGMSYGENQTFAFDNESDRNEMALSLFQENEYVYAQHMAHYPEDYGKCCAASSLASEDLEYFVADYVDGCTSTVNSGRELAYMEPVIDYRDLEKALSEEYGEGFIRRGESVLDILFGSDYQNDCYIKYCFGCGDNPYIDYEGIVEENDSYRAFLIDEYLREIMPADCDCVLIKICW